MPRPSFPVPTSNKPKLGFRTTFRHSMPETKPESLVSAFPNTDTDIKNSGRDFGNPHIFGTGAAEICTETDAFGNDSGQLGTISFGSSTGTSWSIPGFFDLGSISQYPGTFFWYRTEFQQVLFMIRKLRYRYYNRDSLNSRISGVPGTAAPIDGSLLLTSKLSPSLCSHCFTSTRRSRWADFETLVPLDFLDLNSSTDVKLDERGELQADLWDD